MGDRRSSVKSKRQFPIDPKNLQTRNNNRGVAVLAPLEPTVASSSATAYPTVIDITTAKRIGKRLYFQGLCLKETFDKAAMPEQEISDVRWWSFDELLLNEPILNSDLRCWIKKMRAKMSPSFGPSMGPSISASVSV
jgi:hypothetical protein